MTAMQDVLSKEGKDYEYWKSIIKGKVVIPAVKHLYPGSPKEISLQRPNLTFQRRPKPTFLERPLVNVP